jgi:mannobiose 2-epimerase
MSGLRIGLSGLCIVLAFGLAAAASEGKTSGADKSISETYLPRAEKILAGNIVRFWDEKGIDREHGGYIISFDAQGRRVEPVTKMIVTQGRMLWLYSRLARAGYERDKHLAAAEIGYRFLRDKMWDPKSGGFYWEVDVTGNQKLQTGKHLYGQSFALYALSEYYLAGGNKETLDLATRLFNLLEEKAHDKTYGGYIESFNEDWTRAG